MMIQARRRTFFGKPGRSSSGMSIQTPSCNSRMSAAKLGSLCFTPSESTPHSTRLMPWLLYTLARDITGNRMFSGLNRSSGGSERMAT